jgi:hypothetical protein
MPWQLSSKFIPLHHPPFHSTLHTDISACFFEPSPNNVLFKIQSACQGYGKACRGMWAGCIVSTEMGTCRFLAGLHGSQRSFPNSYLLPPRLAESVPEPILRQQPLLNIVPTLPQTPFTPPPFNAYLHFLEPPRDIPASAQRKELAFVRLLGSQKGERNFSCSEVRISTYRYLKIYSFTSAQTQLSTSGYGINSIKFRVRYNVIYRNELTAYRTQVFRA